MDRLEKELETLVHYVENGGGFGDKDAKDQHNRKIDLLKFKITRRDNIRIAVVSALIGTVVGSIVTFLLTKALG